MRIKAFIVVVSMVLAACGGQVFSPVEEGVSRELAKARKQRITFLSYDLAFDIPAKKEEAIQGSVTIGVKLKNTDQPLVLDFKAGGEENVKSLQVNGSDEEVRFSQGHIIISESQLKKGYNELTINFVAGDQSLNRNDEYLYTLLVPDRASTAFPCFDQPDLKARYKLTLAIPEEWVALFNAPEEKSTSAGGKKTVVFEESDLMSTYLFSFVAGKFQTLSHEQNGRSMTMYHREPDSEKVVSNATEIFKLHHEAMDWMEDYTGIKYPFKKFDFVLLPAYQYGGMEHVGAVQYRASRLMLDESASLDDKISRSMLIAHETAHMWFGNLVTMEWFDDVWLKEVFANFMASKITEPNFPEVNHSLNFLFSHYPQAYAVDRTEGANAIRQPLDNLKNAGSMYGAIIYHKAPIVMRQLESLMGDYAFRDALREYLDNFKNKNATWDDLVTIFDLKTELDIKQWSNVWVTQPGMPFIDIEFETGDEASEYDVVQYDLSGEGKVWPQKFDITFAYPDGDIFYPVYAENVHFIIKKNLGTAMPEHILLNSNGMGYGIFAYGLEYIKDDFIFNLAKVDIPSISDDLQRGVSYLVLHEYLLHEGMNPRKYMRFLEEYIFVEDNELILTYLLNNLELIYWKFLTPEQNKQYAAEVESLLIQKLGRVSDPKVKHLIFKKYVSMAQTETGVQNLMRFWSMQDTPKGITLTEEEYILLAYHIELKANQKTEVIPDMIARLENPDKKAEVTFVAQAIAGDVAAREKFFASLLSPENRSHESWVNKALYYLHHPLRAQTSIDLLEDGLEELEEIQRTGDIFFPKRWLDNTLWGYNSPEAIEIINDYLASSGGMDEKLKQKVLQAADMVFRAERDISQYGTVEE